MTLGLHHKLSTAFEILTDTFTNLRHHIFIRAGNIHLFLLHRVDILDTIDQTLHQTLVGPDRVEVYERREALLVEHFDTIFAEDKRRPGIPIKDLNAQICSIKLIVCDAPDLGLRGGHTHNHVAVGRAGLFDRRDTEWTLWFEKIE